MALLPILKYPHRKLRQAAAEITAVDDSIRALAKDMQETMAAAAGVGLAAPQVGKLSRLLVVDIDRDSQRHRLVLANPVILQKEGDITWEEGCLSIPDITAPVARARYVKVTGLNMDGEPQTVEAEELLAVCLQHEIDHLNGVLFIDHISKLRRARLLVKYRSGGKKNAAPSL